MPKAIPLLIASTLILAGVAGAQDGHYASKADERAGRLTPGSVAAAPGNRAPNVGGEDCTAPTPILSVPFSDSDDTTGNVDDLTTLPVGCSDYTSVAGPDLVYSFTAGNGASLTFTVTPNSADYDTAVYVLGTCGNAMSCLSGHDTGFAGDPETIPTQAYPVGTHAVYVDSYYAATTVCPQNGLLCGFGPYTLTISGTLPAELIQFRIE